MRFLNQLPLLHGYDYETLPPTRKDGHPLTHTGRTGKDHEYRLPFACTQTVIATETSDSGDSDQWVMLHKLTTSHGANLATADGETGDYTTDYSLYMDRFSCGFRIVPRNGLNHMLSDASLSEPSRKTGGEIDPDNEVYVTVAAEFPHYAESRWPSDEHMRTNLEADDPDLAHRLVLYVKDDYRLDYLVPDTIVDIEGVAVRATEGGFVRDDRTRMEQVARMAYEWYSIDRAAFSFSFRQLLAPFAVTSMITTVGSGDTEEVVRTVVTAIDYDLTAGTTSLETSFAEIDFAGLL
jgi:hypothetical protein